MAGLQRPRSAADIAALAVATGLGSGYSPVAPGTCGTLVAVPLVLLLAPAGPATYLAVSVLILFVGIGASKRVITLTGGHDPQLIVIDEIVGYLFTMALIEPTSVSMVVGFGLFRYFDIRKPQLVKRMESLSGGWGVVMDDFLAGVYGNMALRALLWIFEPP